jgi:hypothetical protein
MGSPVGDDEAEVGVNRGQVGIVRAPVLLHVPSVAISEKAVRLAQTMQVGPCIPVGIQLKRLKFCFWGEEENSRLSSSIPIRSTVTCKKMVSRPMADLRPACRTPSHRPG